jgi:hypothetical protein
LNSTDLFLPIYGLFQATKLSLLIPWVPTKSAQNKISKNFFQQSKKGNSSQQIKFCDSQTSSSIFFSISLGLKELKG